MQHWHPANSLFDFLLLSKRRTIKWALWFHTSIKTDTNTNTNCLRRQWQDANNTLEVKKKTFHWVPDVLSTKHEFSTRGIHPTSFHITPQVIEIISETAVKMGTTCPQLYSASLHLWAELNVIIILSFSGVFPVTTKRTLWTKPPLTVTMSPLLFDFHLHLQILCYALFPSCVDVTSETWDRGSGRTRR